MITFFKEVITLLGPSRKPKVFCMFDNMNKENRLIINALCEYDPLQEWGTWRIGDLLAPNLLKKLVKYKPNAKKAFSYSRIILIKYKGRKFKIDLSNGDIVGAFRNTKFKEGEYIINGFSIFNHHQTSNDLLFQRRIVITIPNMGKIILTTHNRGVNIELKESLKHLSPANSRGALVSELCAREIPALSTVLPLTKSVEELDYANNILKEKWEQSIERHEKWLQEDPKNRGAEPPKPKSNPTKVDWPTSPS